MNNDGVVIADDASFTSTTSSHVMTPFTRPLVWC